MPHPLRLSLSRWAVRAALVRPPGAGLACRDPGHIVPDRQFAWRASYRVVLGLFDDSGWACLRPRRPDVSLPACVQSDPAPADQVGGVWHSRGVRSAAFWAAVEHGAPIARSARAPRNAL